jgi:hypothetical protein
MAKLSAGAVTLLQTQIEVFVHLNVCLLSVPCIWSVVWHPDCGHAVYSHSEASPREDSRQGHTASTSRFGVILSKTTRPTTTDLLSPNRKIIPLLAYPY